MASDGATVHVGPFGGPLPAGCAGLAEGYAQLAQLLGVARENSNDGPGDGAPATSGTEDRKP